VKAAVVLHNFLRTRLDHYCPPNYVDVEMPNGEVVSGLWRLEAPALDGAGNRNRARASHDAWDYREQFADFFQGEGAVPWQIEMVTNTGEEYDSDFA